MNCSRKYRNFKRVIITFSKMNFRGLKLGVEIPILFVYVGIYIGDAVNTNFIIFRTCEVVLGHNRSDCEKLGSDNKDNYTIELEKLTEPTADIILTTVGLFSQIIPAIYCLFIGPWSDKNGRKKILIITLFGSFILFTIKAIVSLIPNASPWFLMLECIPIVLTGGVTIFMMMALCYITNDSSDENRGIRMAIYECMITSGILIGTISSSYLFEALGYTGVFSLVSCFQLIALILICFIKETIVIDESEGNSSLLSIKPIKEMFETTIKQRSRYVRPILFILIASLVLFQLAISNRNIFFLYVRAKFEWSLKKYTHYSTITSIIWILGTFFSVYIMHKLLKISEIILLLVGFITMAASTALQAFAIVDWQLYAAVGIGFLGGVVTPMVRSLLSKQVPVDEIGKIFALTITFESFATLIAGPIFTGIYNSTIYTFPGMFNLFETAIYILETIFIVIVVVLKRYQTRWGSIQFENIIPKMPEVL